MDFSVINLELVAKLVLLLLIGMGPKIALVPFLKRPSTSIPRHSEPRAAARSGSRLSPRSSCLRSVHS